MIRVLIKCSSPMVKARLEALLHSYPELRIIDQPTDELGSQDLLLLGSQPDVVLVQSENLPGALTTEPPGSLSETLTASETEVLRAMVEGLANKEIAARLGISENTIKFHVASLMGKLGAGSRTEAVMPGIRHGIVLI